MLNISWAKLWTLKKLGIEWLTEISAYGSSNTSNTRDKAINIKNLGRWKRYFSLKVLFWKRDSRRRSQIIEVFILIFSRYSRIVRSHDRKVWHKSFYRFYLWPQCNRVINVKTAKCRSFSRSGKMYCFRESATIFSRKFVKMFRHECARSTTKSDSICRENRGT